MSETSEQTGSEATHESSSESATQQVGEQAGTAATSGTEASVQGNTDAAAAHDDDAGEGGEGGEGGEDAGEADGETSAGGVSAEGAQGAPGTGKRKRRRRKKRKDGATSTGDVNAQGEGEAAHRPEGGKKKESHAPFAHLFAGGQAAKRHAFAVGEVVAGRVQRVDHGVIIVDLFGKATAIMDEYEPRDIPVMPEPGAEASAQVSGEAPAEPSDAASEITAVGEVAASVGDASTEASAGLEANAQPTDAAASVTSVETAAADDADADADADEGEDDTASAVVETPREKPETPNLGQIMKGRVGAVSESGHIAILNRIIDVPAARAVVQARRNDHKRVEGVVYGFNRGGFDVMVEGLRAFCPASAMSLGDIPDPLEFVGKKLEFLLPASKTSGRDIIVSRRSILERLQRRQAKEFLRSITPGQRFKGRVTAVREFGVFVDIGGGVEGLVHQSELSYAFGVKPSSVAQVGDELDVQVLRVGGGGERETNKRDRVTRVSLSVKALLQDPWDEHAAELVEGTVRKGKVVRATDFGAFVELVGSIEGLLHISELGRELKHADQAVREGEDIYVVIDRVDRRARRISLSKLSAQEVQEFEAGTLTLGEGSGQQSLRQGANVKLKVERIEPRAVLARVAGTLGKRGRAFVPSSETGTDRGTDLRKRFPLGSEFEAKIIGIDRDGSLKCSVKAMQVDEERQAVKSYRREAAKQGFGTFGDLLRAKLESASSDK